MRLVCGAWQWSAPGRRSLRRCTAVRLQPGPLSDPSPRWPRVCYPSPLPPLPRPAAPAGQPDWLSLRVHQGGEDEQGGGLGRHDLTPVCCVGGRGQGGGGNGGLWTVDGPHSCPGVMGGFGQWMGNCGAHAQQCRGASGQRRWVPPPGSASAASAPALSPMHGAFHTLTRMPPRPPAAAPVRPRTRSSLTWLWACPPARSRPALPAAPSACPSTTRWACVPVEFVCVCACVSVCFGGRCPPSTAVRHGRLGCAVRERGCTL
jgi:hypothetical protein